MDVSRQQEQQLRRMGRDAVVKAIKAANEGTGGMRRVTAKVTKVNSDYTVDVDMGDSQFSMPITGLRYTTACCGVRVGDTVLVDVVGHLATVTGILATADNGPYVKGSVYITCADVDPNDFLPGRWERVEGRFLLGADSRHALGSTGGEESHSLSWNEMLAHSHDWGHWLAYDKGHWGTDGSSGANPGAANGSSTPFAGGPGSTGSAGGGAAHNNMPPYLAVNIWRRVA